MVLIHQVAFAKVRLVCLVCLAQLGKFFSPASVLQQAQAVESPTTETVEPTTEIPTTEFTPTPAEPESPTDEPAGTATTEPTLPPSETVVVETSTVSVEPTQTEIPAKAPRVTPTNSPEPFPTFTPEAKNGTVLYESAGNLFMQSVDSEGSALDVPRAVEAGKSAEENILDIFSSQLQDQYRGR